VSGFGQPQSPSFPLSERRDKDLGRCNLLAFRALIHHAENGVDLARRSFGVVAGRTREPGAGDDGARGTRFLDGGTVRGGVAILPAAEVAFNLSRANSAVAIQCVRSAAICCSCGCRCDAVFLAFALRLGAKMETVSTFPLTLKSKPMPWS